MNKKLAVFISIAVFIVAAYFLFNQQFNISSEESIGVVNQDFSKKSSATADDWQTYQNDKFGFKIRHPSGYRVEERRSPDGTTFISIYSGSAVSALNAIQIYAQENLEESGIDTYEKYLNYLSDDYLFYLVSINPSLAQLGDRSTAVAARRTNEFKEAGIFQEAIVNQTSVIFFTPDFIKSKDIKEMFVWLGGGKALQLHTEMASELANKVFQTFMKTSPES